MLNLYFTVGISVMYIRKYIYCGIIRYRGGLIFVEFPGTSLSKLNILNKYINYDYKVIFFVCKYEKHTNYVRVNV